MKVLFISRATLYTSKGGDTVQIMQTARSLRQLDVEVDIALSNDKKIDYSQYQLLHFFNIIRPADIIYHADKSGLPYVVSPIYLSYEDIPKTYKHPLYRALGLLGKHGQEYVKTLARCLKNGEKVTSWKYIFLGHRRAITYILRHCTYLLPNSHSEYSRLKADFPEAGRFAVIPNSIDTAVFHEDATTPERKPALLCVARIEPIKNQLNVINALRDTNTPITFVGDAAPNHSAYYQECRRAAYGNVQFISHQEPATVAALYQQHQTHILASWFETTGLSSLEAAACGCTLVVSEKGDTREYFSDHVQYCHPGDLQSIRNAVQQALQTASDPLFAGRIARENNWDMTAQKTITVYKRVLDAQG